MLEAFWAAELGVTGQTPTGASSETLTCLPARPVEGLPRRRREVTTCPPTPYWLHLLTDP